MIEAEIKYVVRASVNLKQNLDHFARPSILTYDDAYFDHSRLNLTASDAELRVRLITDEADNTKTILTYKGGIVDEQTKSKTEFEVGIDAPAEDMRALLSAMGFYQFVRFVKHCQRYEFTFAGRHIAATIVNVDEIQRTYLEVESLLRDAAALPDGLTILQNLASHLGLSDADRTTEAYSEMVLVARSDEHKP